ncbi:CHAT domain-containing protein [Desmonostoc muscorum CCALA 125]|nr:CHAT domain-containing protein [Desmonostoc muscorum CCALA 125]
MTLEVSQTIIFDLLEITIQHKKETFWPVIAEYRRKGEFFAKRYEGKLQLNVNELLTQVTPLNYGKVLGAALFQGSIKTSYTTALSMSSSSNKLLRILLFIEAEDLRTYRWERLCISTNNQWDINDEENWDFLVLQQQTPFSLHLPSTTDKAFQPIGREALQALVIVATPDDQENYGLNSFSTEDAIEAIDDIVDALGEIPCDLLATVEGKDKKPIGKPTRAEISKQLVEKHYTLLHFVCHGRFEKNASDSQAKQDNKFRDTILYLADETNHVKPLAGKELIKLIKQSNKLPHFAFLCTCDSAKPEAEAEDAWGGLAQRLVRELGMPAVVAMTDKVTIKLALDLEKRFYERLLVVNGYVDQALVEATASLVEGLENRFEIGVPFLFSRLRYHPLFSDTLDKAKVLTPNEIKNGLTRFAELLPQWAPILKEEQNLLEALKKPTDALSHQELQKVEGLCREVLQEISFKELALNQPLPSYDPRCPFQGLSAFTWKEREFFKGRGDLINELEKKLEHNFLAVLGASGSGKSSVVMAGLIPTLQDKEQNLQFADLTPGSNPLSQLDIALKKVHNQPFVLVVDQFEEVFTLCTDPTEREKFINQLLELKDNQKVIVTMRADFWGDCASHDELKKLMLANQELIAPMDKIDLREAVQKQAEAVDLRFEADLLNRIFDDLDDEPGLMPLLQHALLKLWERRHGKWLHWKEYRTIAGEEGTGIRGAIANTAEDFLAKLCKEAKEDPKLHKELYEEKERQVKNIFLRLIRLDEDAALGKERDTRKRVYIKDLLDIGKPEEIKNLVRRLAGEEARLVVTNRDLTKEGNEEDQETVEIAHEALIRYWKRLRTWLEDNRADLLLRQTIGQEAFEWENHKKDEDQGESYLALHGSRLEQADRLSKRDDKFLIKRQVDYVKACIERRDRLKEREKQLMRESLEKAISALAESARTLFISNKKLDALAKLIEAGELLQNFPEISPDVKFQFLVTFGQILDETAEFNSFEGHKDWVYGVSFSPYDQTIASASGDKTIKLWSFNGRLLQTLEEHEDEVIDVSFSPDGEMLASVSKDKMIKLWRKNTFIDTQNQWTLCNTLEGHTNWVVGVGFSPNSQIIASASEDKTIRLWNKNGNLLISLNGHQAGVMNVAFSPNGKLIASASKDRTVKLWDLETYELISTFEEHSNEVSAVSFSPDNKTLLSSSWDRTIMVWDINGNVESVISHEEKVYYAAFSPDGKTIASASKDGIINLYKKNGCSKKTLRGHRDGVTKISCSPDSKILVSSSCDKTLKIWDCNSKFVGHSSEIIKIDFNSNGDRIATASEDGIVKIWNRTGELLHNLEDHDGCVFDVKFSPDGKTIATTSKNEVKIWNLKKGQQIDSFSEYKNLVRSISFSPEGKIIIIGYFDGTVILWNIDNDESKIFKKHTGQVNMITFSPIGTMFATASSDKTVKLWDLNGNIQYYKEYDSSTYYVSFSHDGKVIAISNINEIELWNPYNNYQQTLQINNEDYITNLSFFADSQMLCAIDNKQTIKLWRIDNGELLQNIEANGISSAALSRDMSAIAIADSEKNKISLWILNPEELVTITKNFICDYLKFSKNK